MGNPNIRLKKGSVTLIEKGIIKFALNENAEWSLEDAIETHQANLKLSQGGKYCVYMNSTRFFIPSKESQQFVTSKECTKYRVAAAFVIKNKGVQLFFNLFIKLFKSKSPIKMFHSEEQAMKWMRKLYQEASRIPS